MVNKVTVAGFRGGDRPNRPLDPLLVWVSQKSPLLNSGLYVTFAVIEKFISTRKALKRCYAHF